LGLTLAALNQLEDTFTVRRLQSNVRVAATQIEERGTDTLERQQVPTPGVGRNPLDNCVITTVPLSR
jgi:hypothetical protein